MPCGNKMFYIIAFCTSISGLPICERMHRKFYSQNLVNSENGANNLVNSEKGVNILVNSEIRYPHQPPHIRGDNTDRSHFLLLALETPHQLHHIKVILTEETPYVINMEMKRMERTKEYGYCTRKKKIIAVLLITVVVVAGLLLISALVTKAFNKGMEFVENVFLFQLLCF